MWVQSGPGGGRPLPAAARRWCRARLLSTFPRGAAEPSTKQTHTGSRQLAFSSGTTSQPAQRTHILPLSPQTFFRDPPPTTRGNGQTGHLLKTLIWLPVSERESEREIQKDREDAVVLGGAAPATGVLVARRAAGRRLRHLPPARHPHRRGRKPQARR